MEKPALLAILGLGALALVARADESIAPNAAADRAPVVQTVALQASAGPLIVLDPGHGGGNAGAPGVTAEIHEKHVTMNLAQTLAPRLSELGYRVVLTRHSDVYLTLRERVARANRLGADLFVSLHANATETHAQRGYETFVLSPRAIDVDARALRLTDGPERPGLPADVALVLDDIERGLAQPKAADLAAAIQAELRKVRDPADDRGVKQESQHVLLGAVMPAVLVEIGFVDHALEGRELLEEEVQSSICDALVRALVATLPPPAQ